MLAHVRSAIEGSLKGNRPIGENNPPGAANSRVDYLLWL
jgi:hypothetical protein